MGPYCSPNHLPQVEEGGLPFSYGDSNSGIPSSDMSVYLLVLTLIFLLTCVLPAKGMDTNEAGPWECVPGLPQLTSPRIL